MDEGVRALFSLPHRNLISSYYHNVLGVGICGYSTMVPFSDIGHGAREMAIFDKERFLFPPFFTGLYYPHLILLIRRTHHRLCGSPYFFSSFLFP